MNARAKVKTPPSHGLGSRPRSEAGPRCTVCRSEALREITSALASGASINSVAKQFHFTTPTMWKHAKRHTGAALLATNIAEPTLTAIRRLKRADREDPRRGRARQGPYHGVGRDPGSEAQP